jgi:uncharacterized membrane protein
VKPQRWFEIIVAFTAVTLLVTYLIPSDTVFVYVRGFIAFIFVVFLPGNCLVNLLFRGKNSLDLIEGIVLSVALSLSLAGLIGLFLGLSPIGITFESITISLSITVLALATAAFVRRLKESSVPKMQVP